MDDFDPWIPPQRRQRLPWGYREEHLEHSDPKWVRLTFVIIAVTGGLMLYGLYRLVRVWQ